MLHFRTRYRWAAALTLVAVLIAGCGGTAQAPAPAPAAPAAKADAAAKPAPAPAPAATPQAAAKAAPAEAKMAPVTLKMIVPTPVVAFAVPFLARQAGLYAAENVTVSEIALIPGAPAFAALKNGDAQMLFINSDAVYRFVEQGDTDFMMVQQVLDANTQDFVVRPQYAQKKGVTPKSPVDDRIKAMQGGKWGLTSATSPQIPQMNYMARRVGLNPEKDMEYPIVGGGTAMWSAVKAGQIDGFVQSPPAAMTAEAEGWGINLIPYFDIPEFKGVPHEAMIVTRAWAEKNPAVVRAVIRANIKARQMLSADAKAAAQQLAKVEAFKTVGEDTMTKVIEYMKFGFGTGPGTFDAKQIAAHVAIFQKAGALKEVNLKEGVHWTNQYMP